MENSISIVQVLFGGQDYVAADVVVTHPTGLGFGGTTRINVTDGSISAVVISNHGRNYKGAMFLSILLYYPGTDLRMDDSITALKILVPGSTARCFVGMIISAVGGGGQHFQANIGNVNYLTGAIESVSIIYHGSDYSADPELVISSSSCTCYGLAGNVAGNFKRCLIAQRAHGAIIGGRVAENAQVKGLLPRVHLSGLKGVQNSDKSSIPLQRYGFHFEDGTEVLRSAQWDKASHTFVMRLQGTLAVWAVLCACTQRVQRFIRYNKSTWCAFER
jgi:hypothetical protein